MKLLIENIEDFEVITESDNNKKNYYIHGIFMQAEVKNKNGRLYPKSVMENAVNKYITEMVNKNRAVGEMNHPDNPSINPDRISHLITELKFDGNNVLGKAKVLDTTCGKQLKALIDGGVVHGVSSRALGSLKEENGIKIVQPDLMINAIDCVFNPSGPDCYVEAILEEAEWVMKNGEWVKNNLEESQKILKKASKKDIEIVAIKIFENFIKSI